jgi:hypothetical protein
MEHGDNIEVQGCPDGEKKGDNVADEETKCSAHLRLRNNLLHTRSIVAWRGEHY